ncbi:MAG: DNA polymerase I [Anaerolineales bacterium]|nr:DNA polymerase I [Anaerolineales bacterium]
MPPVLYLIDGHALAYRTYYAITRGSGAGFHTRSGEPTAGIFGFASVLLRILEQENPDYLAVAFDTGRTFRDDLFADYKGTRAKMPDDLRPQIERVRQLVDAFNIPRLEMEGYEADDVLGSVACQAVARGLGVKIITGDRDLLQLVGERIIVSLPGKSLSDSKDYLPEDVLDYLGVRPEQVVDFKALVGDKSDNIPGVDGIGEKTAASLLEKYGALDEIYSNLDALAPAVRARLEKGRENAYLSRQLATIVKDLDIPLDLEKARPQRFDPSQVEALFRELEFRTLMGRLTELMQAYGKRIPSRGQQLNMFDEVVKPRGAVAPPPSLQAAEADGSQAVLVNTPEALNELVGLLNSAKVISFDTETTSTDQMRAELVGIALAVQPDRGYYIPVGHVGDQEPQLPLAEVMQALRAPLTNPDIPKAGHNLKYDYVLLRRYGLNVHPLAFDSMIAEWLVNPESRNLGLKNLAWVRQGIKMTEIQELIGKGKSQISMAEVPPRRAAAYAAADALAVLRLAPELASELETHQAKALFDEIEMPLVPILAEMEMNGVALDTHFLEQMSTTLSERLGEIEAQIYTEVGASFNLNSTQQLSEALFERLGIEPPDRTKRTKSGHYSTSAEILEALSGRHPVVDRVLEYRELSKLKSTYVDALPLQVNPATMRVHTSYNQTGSVTGRIASSDPNLQNIPIRTDLGRQVRKAFVASPGHQLLAVDYSQVELRIVAHMANDRAMIAAFRAGQDIHATTAAAIYGVPLEAVDKNQRRRAKGVNFGLIYGMSAFGLTRYTDLTLAESEDFMLAYFEQFPGVKTYLDGMRRLAAEQGYVETLLGRRRYFPGLKNQSDYNRRGREEREAINAPIQGTAADVMKIAMLRVPAALSEAGLSARMILQVHDELVLECPNHELAKTSKLVQEVMENAYQLSVPLATEARCGLNWGQMETLKS